MRIGDVLLIQQNRRNEMKKTILRNFLCLIVAFLACMDIAFATGYDKMYGENLELAPYAVKSSFLRNSGKSWEAASFDERNDFFKSFEREQLLIKKENLRKVQEKAKAKEQKAKEKWQKDLNSSREKYQEEKAKFEKKRLEDKKNEAIRKKREIEKKKILMLKTRSKQKR